MTEFTFFGWTIPLKGYSAPKRKFCHYSLIRMSFQLQKIFARLRNTIKDILDENREACDCPIDCQVNYTVKAQKSMKNIARILHLPSVVQFKCYEVTRIPFVRKEIKIFFFQQFVSSRSLLVTVAPFWILPIEHKLHTLFCIRLYVFRRRTKLLWSWNDMGVRD